MTETHAILDEAQELFDDEEYNEVLELLDGHPSEASLCLRVQALLELEEFEGALDELEEFDEALKGVEPFTLRGLAHYYLGDQQEALDAFGQARALDPTDIASLHGRALVYHDMEFFKAANLDLDRALMLLDDEDLEMDPDERALLAGQTYNIRAGFLLEEGEDLAADEALRLAYRADPTEAEYALDVARLSMLGGRIEDAKQYAALAVEADEYCFEGRLLQSQLSAVVGDHDRAIELARAALSLDPEEPFAQIMLASVLSMGARFSEALDAADRAIELDPELADGYQLKAAALEALGRQTEVDSVMKGFLQEPPDLPGYLFGERFDPYEANNEAMAELASMNPDELRGLAEEMMQNYGMPEALKPMIDQVMNNLPELVQQLAGGNAPAAEEPKANGPFRVIEGGKGQDSDEI